VFSAVNPYWITLNNGTPELYRMFSRSGEVSCVVSCESLLDNTEQQYARVIQDVLPFG
jgi:hypothetical protein